MHRVTKAATAPAMLDASALTPPRLVMPKVLARLLTPLWRVIEWSAETVVLSILFAVIMVALLARRIIEGRRPRTASDDPWYDVEA